jgi:hypothetical protein
MHSPLLHKIVLQTRLEELRRAGARASSRPRPPLPVRRPPVDEWVTLRFAFPDDAEALRRLALLDSATPLTAPVLVADIGGELRAALSLRDGKVLAHPFHPSRALVQLLRARARQLDVPGSTARGRWSGLRSRARLAAWR